jgi:hypothetical protein
MFDSYKECISIQTAIQNYYYPRIECRQDEIFELGGQMNRTIQAITSEGMI